MRSHTPPRAARTATVPPSKTPERAAPEADLDDSLLLDVTDEEASLIVDIEGRESPSGGSHGGADGSSPNGDGSSGNESAEIDVVNISPIASVRRPLFQLQDSAAARSAAQAPLFSPSGARRSKMHGSYGAMVDVRLESHDQDNVTSQYVTLQHRESLERLPLRPRASSPPQGGLTSERKVWLVTMLSLLSNLCLLGVKIWVALSSRSLAVFASLVDTVLDLVAQGIIWLALYSNRSVDRRKWPVGRTRLEPVGIIVVASLMGIASLQIFWEGISRLIAGTLDQANRKVPTVSELSLELLVGTIALKIVLWLVCVAVGSRSDTVKAIADDHRNDVISNLAALATAWIASVRPDLWYLDPAGAILISLYICINWLRTAREQTAMLVGRSADPEFTKKIAEMANSHHSLMVVDIVRAYHIGRRFLVEVEVVMPREMVLEDAHDISLDLQKRIERLNNVERAFVHVDYLKRGINEHKVAVLHTPPGSPRSQLSGYSGREDAYQDGLQLSPGAEDDSPAFVWSGTEWRRLRAGEQAASIARQDVAKGVGRVLTLAPELERHRPAAAAPVFE